MPQGRTVTQPPVPPGPTPGHTPGPTPEPPATEPGICSAKGCTAPATWELRWNNPRLHTPERRKVWLACDDHRDTLGHFLGSRGFLKETAPHR
jgi:hypothetical protein